MSPSVRLRAERSETVDRLLREVKQSPTKAIALSVGILVALWVWIPRLFGASNPEAPSPAPTTADSGWDSYESRGDFSTRDSLSIRAEFIAISEEARRVRRFADPWLGAKSPRDPFRREQEIAAPVPVAAPTEPSAAEEKAAADLVVEAGENERARALALELRGIFDFQTDRSALLANRVVRVGDRIDGFTVVAIAARSIVLRGEHGEYERRLKDPLERDGDRQEQR